MARPGKVEIEGLDELRRDCRAAGGNASKRLQQANKRASDVVAQHTRESFIGAHGAGPHSASIRARASQARAEVVAGSERAPAFLGLNFGSGQGPHTRQFPQRREPDYFLYSTVSQDNETIMSEWESAVRDWIRDDLRFR